MTTSRPHSFPNRLPTARRQAMSRIVLQTFLTFFAFDFFTGAYAGLPKWGTLIAGPPPPVPLRSPITMPLAAEYSPSIPLIEFSRAPEISAAMSTTSAFPFELMESPGAVAPVSTPEFSESPQVSVKRLWTVYDGAEDGQGREDLLLMVGGWMLGQL